MSSPTEAQMRDLIAAVKAGGNGGGSATALDRELVTTVYLVKTAFTGANIGDTVTETQVLDLSGASPSTMTVLWRNQTQSADLSPAPSTANLSMVGRDSLTDVQLRASAVGVTDTPLLTFVKQRAQSYQLATAGNLTPANNIAGDGYVFDIRSTGWGGGSVALRLTDSAGNYQTLGTFTADGTATFNIGVGSSVQLVVTGSPSALNARLSGMGGPVTPAAVPVAVQAVTTPIPALLVTGQVKIATAGTAVQLPANVLANGVIIKLDPNASGKCTVGPVGVTNVTDGTGNGWILYPGESVAFSVPNTNLVYVNGPAGAIFSFEGN